MKMISFYNNITITSLCKINLILKQTCTKNDSLWCPNGLAGHPIMLVWKKATLLVRQL